MHRGIRLPSAHVLSWVPWSQVLGLYLVPQHAVEFEFFPSHSMDKLSHSLYFRLFCKGKWPCWKLINIIFYSSQRSISNHCCGLGLQMGTSLFLNANQGMFCIFYKIFLPGLVSGQPLLGLFVFSLFPRCCSWLSDGEMLLRILKKLK